MGIVTGYLSRLLADATATTSNSTILTGGSSQVLLTAKTRKGYWVQNTSANPLYINRGGGTASATNYKIDGYATFTSDAFENVSTKIEIFGLVTSQTFCYGEYV